MHRSAIFLALLAVSGCGESPPPGATVAAAAADRPKEFQPPQWSEQLGLRRFEVVDFAECANVPKAGLQHRRLYVVIPEPDSKDEVLAVARHLYGQLREDIERTQSDAARKKINVIIYDSREDYDVGGALICQIVSGDEPQRSLPETDDAAITYPFWKHPEDRPSRRMRAMYRDYLYGIKAASKTADAEVNGTTLADVRSRDLVQKREIRKVLVSMQEKFELSEAELLRCLRYVRIWRQGNELNQHTLDIVADDDFTNG